MLSRPVATRHGQDHSPEAGPVCSLIEVLLDATLGPDLDINAPDASGQTPLAYAICSESKGDVEACLRFGARVLDMSVDGYTMPLQWAASRRYNDIFQLMISSGADPTVHFADGSSVLHWAVKRNLLDCVATLLDIPRVDINVLEFQRQGTPLHDAAEAGHVDIAQLLIKKGS